MNDVVRLWFPPHAQGNNNRPVRAERLRLDANGFRAVEAFAFENRSVHISGHQELFCHGTIENGHNARSCVVLANMRLSHPALVAGNVEPRAKRRSDVAVIPILILILIPAQKPLV